MNQKCNSCQQREGIRANLIDLLCNYVKSGNQYYLRQTNCEDERKYNYIISKLEELKKNKKNQNYQACLVEKLLTTTKWTEQYEAEINRFYNKKQANVICERLRIIEKRDQILEDVIISLRQYNTKTKFSRFTSADSVKEQVDSLINKIYFYQEAIKIISEYPTNVNLENFKEFNNQKAASLDPIQKSNLEKIYCIKETIRTIERILQPFRTSKNKNGFIDEQLTDKILIPCQNLTQIRKQAQQSLRQLCNSNTYTKFQSKNNSIIPLKNIIEVLSKQQIKMKETIAILNHKIQSTLHRCKFPFIQSEPSIFITRSIDNMISKIDSIYEIVNYYSIFGDRIQDLRVKSDKGHNYISSSIQWEYIFGHPSMESKKTIWRKKLSNNLRFLKDQLKIDIQVQIKQFKHQSPKQIILEGQIQTETSVNKLSQQQQSQSKKALAQLCDQNRIFIKRWQTIWIRLELEKKHNNYIDPLKIPLKGQNDEQLKALCQEIQNLCKCKQILTDITGKDVYLSSQRLSMIKSNLQFLSANLDISQQIYKDKQTINKLIHIENKLKIQISHMNETYKDLYSQYQVFREILDKLFEKMQLIKNKLNLTVLRQQNQSKYQQIPTIINALTSKNTYIRQKCTILQKQNQCIKEGQKFFKIQLEEVKRSKKVLEIEKQQIIKSLQRSQSELKQQLNIKKIQISCLVEIQETLDQRYKNTLQQHNNTINQLNAQKLLNQSNRKQITQLSHQLQAKNQALLQLQLLNQNNNRKLELKQSDLSRANNQNLKLKETLDAIKFQSLFNIKGQIYNNIHVVNAITKQIKAQFNRNIKSATNLLFLDKRMIKIKPKIDVTSLCNHQYNFIVIKTTNKIIACFVSTPLSLTSQKISHKPVEKSFLLVGNEANCCIYDLKESNKLNFEINSLHSYIIIGKSDLRIDLLEGKITSNMGQNETQFDSKGKKGKEIFGGDNIPFESLEIYKVQFQEKKNQQYSVNCKTYSQIGEKKNTYSTVQIKNQVEQYKNQVEADYTRLVQPQFQQNNQDFFESACQEVRQNYQQIFKQFQSKIYSHIARYLQPKINLQVIQKKVANLKDRKKEGEQQIKLLSESLDLYKQRCFKLQKNIDEFKISNQRNRQNQQNQQSSEKIIQNYKKQIQNLNTLVRKHKLEISNLSLQLQTTKNDLKNQQLQLENIKLEMSMMQQEKNQSNQTDQAQLYNQKRTIQEQKRKYKDLQANKQRQINWLQEQLRYLRDKVDRLQNDYINATKQIKQKNLIISESKKQIENINKTMKNSQFKKAPETSLRQTLQTQIFSKYQSQFEAHKKKFTNFYTQRWSNCPPEIKEANLDQIYLTYIELFFQGELLQDQIILKYRLMSHIQKLTSIPILRTRLIYNFDLRNKANFHVYIDKVQSLLCIIKLKSGVFLAGYYTGEYLQGPMTQPGLLINLTKNESYFLNVAQNSNRTSYRSMVYDSYFIIFGNAQIRIKTGQNILFSNFGIANSYFNANNKKLVDFIGENKREVQLESYEIYQVLFNNTFDHNE